MPVWSIQENVGAMITSKEAMGLLATDAQWLAMVDNLSNMR